MEIKASSVYDLDVFRAYYNLNMYNGKNPKKKVTNMFVLSAVLLAVAILGVIVLDHDTLMWIMILVILINDLITCCLYFWLPTILYKAESNNGNIENSFIFYDDGFEGSSIREGVSGSSKVKYDMLLKIIESKKYFFLYETKSRAHIIDKTTIQSEDLKMLKAKFAEIMPKDKYMICKDW